MKQSTFALRFLLTLTMAAAVSLPAGFAADPDRPAIPAEESGTDASRLADADLSEQVEIIVRSDLRSSTRTSHGVAVSLKNTSDEDLAGPIVLAVDGTGVEALTLADTDGELTDGAAYIEFIPETGTLRSGQVTRSRRIGFTSEEPLPLANRRAFELSARVGSSGRCRDGCRRRGTAGRRGPRSRQVVHLGRRAARYGRAAEAHAGTAQARRDRGDGSR